MRHARTRHSSLWLEAKGPRLEMMEQASAFFGVTLEYFGVFEELFEYFVLISFRSSSGILNEVFTSLTLLDRPPLCNRTT